MVTRVIEHILRGKKKQGKNYKHREITGNFTIPHYLPKMGMSHLYFSPGDTWPKCNDTWLFTR